MEGSWAPIACFGVQGKLLFVIAEKPSSTVRCPLVVDPPQEASVEPNELLFAPENWSIPISVTVTGLPDWMSDGDSGFAVRVGACESKDGRFHSMGYPDNPAVTERTSVNIDVPMPYVKSVTPSAVHISGNMVTVSGAYIPSSAIVSFGPYVVSDSVSSRRRSTPAESAWTWIFNNITRTMQPVKTEALSQLRTAEVNGETVLVDPSYNRTLCRVMREEGFFLDNMSPNATVANGNRRKQADPRMRGLLRYNWTSDSSLSFVTPCVSEVRRYSLFCSPCGQLLLSAHTLV